MSFIASFPKSQDTLVQSGCLCEKDVDTFPRIVVAISDEICQFPACYLFLMSRNKQSSVYRTIEYIGPRPEKPKRPNVFGGWVILILSVGLGFWFGKPLAQSLKAEQSEPTLEQADILIAELNSAPGSNRSLAAQALAYSQRPISYDPAYYKISYPNGDVPFGKGVAADLVVRTFRELGIDLQAAIHEDMKENFRSYPNLWNAKEPDANIDHRRVANLQRYFERHAEVLEPSRDFSTYEPGDIVVWSLADAEKHIGIVVPGPAERGSEPWVVHHMERGLSWEPALLDYEIESHFRVSFREPN